MGRLFSGWRFRKRVIGSQRKMPDTLLALTKPEMLDAALSTGWEEISRLRVARLMVGYIFGTTTGSVAAAPVTVTAMPTPTTSRSRWVRFIRRLLQLMLHDLWCNERAIGRL